MYMYVLISMRSVTFAFVEKIADSVTRIIVVSSIKICVVSLIIIY